MHEREMRDGHSGDTGTKWEMHASKIQIQGKYIIQIQIQGKDTNADKLHIYMQMKHCSGGRDMRAIWKKFKSKYKINIQDESKDN